MDAPTLGREPHRVALRGLARINAVSRSAAAIWSVLRRRLPGARGAPYRVLDLACGGGDVAAGLQRRASRDGVVLQVDGCDVNATAVELARARSPESTFFRLDALGESLPRGYDAMVSNLFLHHLSPDDAVALLASMAAASPAIVVNDLARGPLGYAAAVVGTRVLSRSPVVHVDGPRSVRAAFTAAEARALAMRARLEGVRVQPAFPWRWLLGWSRG